MKEDTGMKKMRIILLVIAISIPLITWYAWSYYTSDVLTIDEVRSVVIQRPGSMHFEVKPETINFKSIKLVSSGDSDISKTLENSTGLPDKLYIVEYECQGRFSAGFIGPPGPFKPYFVSVILDAYTGQYISMSSKEI